MYQYKIVSKTTADTFESEINGNARDGFELVSTETVVAPDSAVNREEKYTLVYTAVMRKVFE